jgi:PAS domain S-box-containing protein
MIDGEIEQFESLGNTVGPVIEAGLTRYMLTKDTRILNMTMDNLKSTESISRILLINKEGFIKGGTDNKSIGIKLSHNDEKCQRCHIKGQKGIFLKGEQTFRYAHPISNNPECYRCHGIQAAYNGVIIIDFSTSEVEHHVIQHILKESLIFLASFMIVGFSIFALSTALVTKRLNKIIDAVRRFKKGVDTARVKIEGKDELTELGNTFNEMAEEMKIQNREKDEMLSKLSNSYEVLKQSRKKYKDSDDNLKLAQKVAHIGSWHIDIQNNELSWSDESYRMFGVPLNTPLTYEIFLNIVHPEDRDYVDRNWKAALSMQPYDIEHRIIPNAFGIKWVHEKAELIFNDKGTPLSATGTVQDITGRKQAEEEREKLLSELQDSITKISRSQKEWQNTFDSITDLISIHDTNYNIIKANRAFEKHFGLSAKEVINRKCFEVFHGTGIEMTNCPHKITTAKNLPATEDVLDPKTNRILRVSTFPYYSPEGEFIGSIHIAKDVTEEKEKEMRLIMTERLASLGQMASGIAHEINNPLSAIAGCAEGLLSRVMKGRFEPELFENYLKIISEEIMRCKGITTSMLSFVRKTTYEKKEINMNETLDKTIEIIGFQGRLQRVEIKKDYKEGIIIYGSEGELRQVFLSIITNALDAMNDTGAITLETGIEGDTVFIKITDAGPGIPQQHLNRIFDPFFTTKSDKGGTGLGLSIANKIVANHNGAINVISEEGKGTTFKIILPSQ